MFKEDSEKNVNGTKLNSDKILWENISVSLPTEYHNIDPEINDRLNAYYDPISHQKNRKGLRGIFGLNKAQSYCTDQKYNVISHSGSGNCWSMRGDKVLVRCYGDDVYKLGANLEERILRDNEGFLIKYGKITPDVQNCKSLGGYYTSCLKYDKNKKVWNRSSAGPCYNAADYNAETHFDASCITSGIAEPKNCFRPFLAPHAATSTESRSETAS
jgi:hypothetical protein